MLIDLVRKIEKIRVASGLVSLKLAKLTHSKA